MTPLTGTFRLMMFVVISESVKCGGRAKASSRWLLVLLSLSTAACAYRDPFPMQNPSTGAQVTCYSPYTRIKLGLRDFGIVRQCINACERHGYKLVGPPLGPLEPNVPEIPYEDVKPYIPAECLP